jgi:hypothetical protein
LKEAYGRRVAFLTLVTFVHILISSAIAARDWVNPSRRRPKTSSLR